MPRVSQAYRDERSAHLVSAAAELFAQQGFHSTSMAEIIAASGMSAGAVYGYFTSKEELIAAVAEGVLQDADEVFADLLANGATPTPLEAVKAVIDTVVLKASRGDSAQPDLTPIALHVWAEAQTSPSIRARAESVYQRQQAHFAEVARRWKAAGHLPSDADPVHVGSALLALVQGFLVQRLLIPDQQAASYLDGVNALLE
jgi:AcrR family transcriptional regulator